MGQAAALRAADPASGTGHATLSVSALRFTYRHGGEELFDGLDFAFEQGRMTAITGASGRGKSTLLYVLGLMLRPSGGAVLLGGRTVSTMKDAERAAVRALRLGFVFQDAVLDPTRTIVDSVIEPALYAGHRRADVRARAEALLDELGVVARSDHLPGQISGGQAQRVAVARALMNRPDVILADEPTGNLDEHNSATVLRTLASAAQGGRTVVIATHDPAVVERCDRVLTL